MNAARIEVRCPHCDEPYHLDPSLLGKAWRCQNKLCRRPFEIRADTDGKAGDTANNSGKSPTVVDMVPILPAEMAEPPSSPRVKAPKPSKPAEPVAKPAVEPNVATWQAGPPPVRQAKAPAAEVAPAMPAPTPRPVAKPKS